MKERERISNLEELMAESLMRLDRLEVGQGDLKYGQSVLLECMTDLTKVVRKNSVDIEVLKSDVNILKSDVNILKSDVKTLKGDVANLQGSVEVLQEDVTYMKENMVTKPMFTNAFETIVNGFNRMESKMDGMRQDIDILKAR